MVLIMNNKNYESVRAFLVTSLLVCTCAVAQAQSDLAIQLTSSASPASLEKTLSGVESLAQVDVIGFAQYSLLVQELEADFGPFDARLSEPLLSASDMLAERGDYHEAISAAERALHIVRINQGLYSEPQIAIVERLIECNVAVEDWGAVDDNFHYLEFLYNRLFEQGGLQWDYGIAQVADWHVIAINHNLGDDRNEHLREANRLFRLRLVYAEQDDSVDQHVIDVLRHNVKYTAYHLQRQEEEIKTERVFSRFGPRHHDDRADNLAFVD